MLRNRYANWLIGLLALFFLGGLILFLAPISLPIPSSLAATGSKLEQLMKKRVKLPDGYEVSLYATDIYKARLMVETPTGDVIVSSTRTKITLVTADKNGDGRADQVKTLMSGLKKPHGLVLGGEWLYVAEEHRVFRIRYDAQKGAVSGEPEIIVAGVPADDGHSSRTLKKGPDGWFYLAVGSSCNKCRENHPWRAAIIRFKVGGKPQIFATGLRNTVGIDWQPGTNALYGVDNGRDWLGDHFPPDELNHIEQGKFYGWPFRNGNNVPDPDLGSDFEGQAVPPAYGFDAHIAPLSIRFLRHQTGPLQGAALVGQHGSWNRSTKHGYRVVSMHFGSNGEVSKKIFMTGFLHKGEVIGRPVDILERKNGSLLISDDYAGAIWLVKKGD